MVFSVRGVTAGATTTSPSQNTPHVPIYLPAFPASTKNDRVVEWENLGDAVQEGDGIGIGSLAIVANFLSTSL